MKEENSNNSLAEAICNDWAKEDRQEMIAEINNLRQQLFRTMIERDDARKGLSAFESVGRAAKIWLEKSYRNPGSDESFRAQDSLKAAIRAIPEKDEP